MARKASHGGLGSASQLPSGNWQARINLGGRTYRKTLPTEVEALQWCRDIESDVRRGLVTPEPKPTPAPVPTGTVPTVAALWVTYKSGLRLAARTMTYYSQAWAKLEPIVGNVLATDVAPSDVRAIRAHLEGSGWGATRTKGAVQLLGRILQIAVIDGHVVTNPVTAAAIRWPRAKPMERPVLSAADVAALAGHTKSLRDRALVLVLGWGGLRIGEAFALQRRDVDLDRGVLTVRRNIAEVRGEGGQRGRQVVGDGKMHAGRTITLPSAVVDLLREQLRTVPIQPDAWLFPSKAGRPLWVGPWDRNVWKPTLKRWNAQRAAEGLPEVRLRHHDMRSACASLLVDAGASVKDVQAHLGHADIATTLNVYARVRPERADALAARMDELVAGL